MKNTTIFIVFAALLSFAFCSSPDNKAEASEKISQNENRVEVIDFHTTHRCETCLAIEANTKYTLETYFSNELKSGQLSMAVLNVEDDENMELVERLEVYGTSLYLLVTVDGDESAINLTEFAFMKGTDQESFSKELSIKIKRELRKL